MAFIKRRAPSYFHGKIEEKLKQKKSLAVWFPAYLFYWITLHLNATKSEGSGFDVCNSAHFSSI